jgi:hypothetical protein
MFERIVIRDRVQGFPGSPFDVGFLGESMLFYGHAHVIGHTAALHGLINAFGPDLLIDYLRDNYFTFTYQPNFFAVHPDRDGVNFGVATIRRNANPPDHDGFELYGLQNILQPAFEALLGKPGRARRLAIMT